MPKKNVVLWDGTVVAVDEALAGRLTAANTGRRETVVEEGQRARQQYDQENTSAPRAFVEGALDTATLGGYGAIVSRMDGGHRYQVTAQEQSGARFLGEAAAMIAPTGLLGNTAKAVGGLTGVGMADKVGKAIGGIKGQFVEGAILGVGGSVAHANVTGDPLTIESAILDAGIGGIANAGVGMLADKMRTKAVGAEEALAKNTVKAADDELAAKGKQVFDREYPAVDELNMARSSARKEANTLNRKIQADNDAYTTFITSKRKIKAAVGGVDEAINVQAARYRPEGAFGTTDEALAAAQQRAGVKADELHLNGEGQVPSQSVSEGAAGTTVGFNRSGVTPEGVQTRISDRIKLDQRPPMNPEMRERHLAWRKEATEIRQLFAGGREINGGKWGKLDPSIPANPEEALSRLHKLKQEIGMHAPDAAAKIPDTIPSLPQKLLDVPPELPKVKTLEYLSRMDDATIAKMGNSMSQAEANAVERLAKELGIEIRPGNPGGTLADVHAGMKKYRSAMDSVELAESELKAQATTGFGKLMYNASRLMGARAGNRALGGGVVGGAIGWATGNMFGGVAGMMLGSVLMNGKAGVRNSISTLFAKHGAKAGNVIERLGPVTSSLAVKITNGMKDDGGDSRSLAKNRAQEIINLRGAAPDLAYVALEPFMQAPHDIALKLHQKFVGIVNHLADLAPKDPGLSPRGFDSKWVPSHTQAMEFAHRVEAATSPMQALTRAFQGQSHPAAADTLWTVWPGIMGAIAEELASAPETLANLSHSQLSAFSRLFRTPLSGFQIPEIALAAQSMYLPGGAGNPYDANPGAGFGDSPRDLSAQPQGGRPPAAGRSEVAGSNVSRLTE